MPGGKLLGLELLRLAAAFAVLVWHYQHFAFAGNSNIPFVRANQPFYGVLFPLYEYGAYGVDVFWCISGYIFFEKYGALIPAGAVSPMKFLLLRFSRLYPLHVVTLLLVAILQFASLEVIGRFFVYQYNDVFHFLLQLFFASNWGLQRGDSFNGPIWSISVEVLVYALFFASLRNAREPLGRCVAVLTVAVLWRYVQPGVPLATCAALFYAGGLAALLTPSLRRWRNWRAIWTLFLGILVLEPVLAFRHGVNLSFGFLLTYLPVLVVLCATELRTNTRWRLAIEAAGNMTYSSYLLHFPIQLCIVLVYSLLGASIPVYSPLFASIFIVGTFTLSHVVYQHFERPAQQWLRRVGKAAQ